MQRLFCAQDIFHICTIIQISPE